MAPQDSTRTKKVPAKRETTQKTKCPSRAKTAQQPPIWQRIVNAIVTLEMRGQPQPSRHHVAAMCGYPKENGKGYVNALSDLKNQKKFVIVEKTSIRLTELGRSHAQPSMSFDSGNKALLEQAKEKIKSFKGKKIVDILSDGAVHSRQDIPDQIETDVTSKGFVNLLSALKKETFIEYCQDKDGSKAIRLQEWMFPEGIDN